MKILARITLVTALALMAAAPLSAQKINISSYTATPGEGILQGGGLNYFDDTGKQLTDGVFGNPNLNVNNGNGAAYEWVGWRISDPLISFILPGSYNVTQVRVGVLNSSQFGTYTPTKVTINGTDYTPAANAITDGTRNWLTFNQSFTASAFDVKLSDGPNVSTWIFADEIEVYGTPSITGGTTTAPEPATFALMVAGLAGLVVVRGRRTARG